MGAALVARIALLAALAVVGTCGAASSNALPDIDTLRCASTQGPTPQPTSVAALVQISSREQAPLHGVIAPTGHGTARPSHRLPHREPRGRPGARSSAAAQVACQLRTTDDAERAGYIMSANFTEGVGTHFTNWRLIDAPFDPTRPAMLLYGPRLGRTQLVGFSYWVRTDDPKGPDGFAGADDHWHRHYGLCFDRSGLLQYEDVRSPRLCSGVYLNGSDMWMLHAWVVPGAANVWGVFAPLNPQLCRRSAPDIDRCPGLAGS